MRQKEEIYEATLGLLLDRGYDNTPLSLIARELGLSKGGLFHHVSSKEQLLYETIRYVIEKDFFPILEEAKRIKNPEEKLTYFLETYTKLLTENPIAMVTIHEARRLNTNHYNEIRDIWRDVLDFVHNAISEMQDSGKAKPLNKAFSAFTLIGMCSWLFYWFDYSRKDSVEELSNTFNEIFFHGILTDS